MAMQKSPERAFALQKYLLLHSQHDALQKHLSQMNTTHSITPPTPRHYRGDSSFSSSATSSSSSSPEDRYLPTTLSPHHKRSSSISPSHHSSLRPQLVKRRSSLPTVIDKSILDEIEEDEGKLKDINLAIKTTLTELLNCESVRGDRRYRMWIQTRLMDAERELKGERVRALEMGGRRGSLGNDVFEVLV